MTDRALWQAVGATLRHVRERRGWSLTAVMDAGGPHYQTVGANERGELGRVESLHQHAAALGVTLVDVLTDVLSQDPMTPELRQLIARYHATTEEGRAALRAVARVVPAADTEPDGAVETTVTRYVQGE